METMKFQVGETYKTRGGWDAVVLSLNGVPAEPIIAKHIYQSGTLSVEEHGLSGNFYPVGEGAAEHDIMPPDPREKYEVHDANGRWYTSTDSKEAALIAARQIKGTILRFVEDGTVEL